MYDIVRCEDWFEKTPLPALAVLKVFLVTQRGAHWLLPILAFRPSLLTALAGWPLKLHPKPLENT
ncbi:hypothetical protein [Mesorhizobium sp.]|uniref:hypothetical protein n=1 Tax=Mesorhizobium sp. TaxID=1871066 RepID=UPI00121C5772|nr:hypothetical protein [Mesorhizobium sp.]TIO74973.1 MAG: hypothetical protein E5X75_21460 [Mesorhizobium sp.]